MVVINLIGSRVIVDDPFTNHLLYLQVRNLRINIKYQKATMMLELYDPNQPVEQYSSSLVVPCKPVSEFKFDYEDETETETENIFSKQQEFNVEPDKELQQWLEETRQIHNYSAITVKTKMKDEVNYLTGLPIKERQ